MLAQCILYTGPNNDVNVGSAYFDGLDACITPKFQSGGASGTTISSQCSSDCECGHCYYCDSGKCRYGGEGPYGCYRGCQ